MEKKAMKQAVTIFTAKMARRLLREGFTIIDVKPDKTDLDGKRSLFIFKNEDGLMESVREGRFLENAYNDAC